MKSLIQERIVKSGPLGFADYMAMALYEPGRGYYAQGKAQVGREGDFYTSVSVGPVFGQLLARRFLAEWEELGKPATWRITECGAHDGKLAKDILDALRDLDQAAYNAIEYAIPDPLDNLRAAQAETLADHAAKLVQVSDARELKPLPGVRREIASKIFVFPAPFFPVITTIFSVLWSCERDNFKWL